MFNSFKNLAFNINLLAVFSWTMVFIQHFINNEWKHVYFHLFWLVLNFVCCLIIFLDKDVFNKKN